MHSKFIVLTGLLLCLSTLSIAQEKDIVEALPEILETGEPKVFQFVENMPEFPGGLIQLKEYLKKNTHYPDACREEKIEGKVYVNFIVTDEGKIKNIKVLRGIAACKELDTEAIRVVNGMPNWIPGQQQGKNVNTFYTIPVQFTLNNYTEQKK